MSRGTERASEISARAWQSEIDLLDAALTKVLDDPEIGEYARFVRAAPLLARIATFKLLQRQELDDSRRGGPAP